VTLSFREDGLFVAGLRPSTALPPDHPLQLVQQALVRGDERVSLSSEGALVEPELLRSWSDEQLTALGAARLRDPLRVESIKDLRSEQYRWKILLGATPCERRGPWLVSPGSPALLDEDQEEVFALAERVATAKSRSQRLRPLGYLQRLADQRQDLVLAPTLASTRVHIGDQLRITLESAPDGPLPSPQLVDSASGEPVPLDPTELDRVTRVGLVSEESTLLGKRWVVTEPGAVRNTLIAQVARTAPASERRRFVENPTAYLSDDDAFDPADYAERVTGVGEIEAHADETTSSGRDWVGSGVGLVVPDAQGGQVAVPSERVLALHEALTQAIATGSPTAPFDGKPIPATPAMLDAVARVLDGARPPQPRSDEGSARPLVLLIADNEIVLDWAPPPGSARPVDSFDLPPAKVELQPHQRVALRQLQELWRSGSTGALLCDDMGLGKTLQALTFGAWAARQVRSGQRSDRDSRRGAIDIPLAIVGPPALLEGWLRELERRFPSPELPVILWGPNDKLSWTPNRLVLRLQDYVLDGRGTAVTLEHARIDREKLSLASPDVLLISYDQLRRLQFAIGQLRFAVLVADEVHQSKDPNSLRSRALRAMNVDFALALTGTPIENSWRDLWTLCDFSVPGRLGTLREFQTAYPPEGDVGEVGAKLAETLSPVLIRRTRRDILDQLPSCSQTRTEAVMPESQALLYEAERVHHQRAGGHALVLLQRLSQLSLHPEQRADITTTAQAHAWAAASARTAVLWEALRRFQAEGAAVLVFVRSLAMQETLKVAIQTVFGLSHVGVLNGEESLRRRNELVSKVEAGTGFRVLLVSPEVGGVGWNLQFATRAVLLERSWNPAKEAQMIARVHRLGQTLPVEVVTPIAVLPGRPSFDVVLDDLLWDKRTLSESVLAPAEISEGEIAQRFRELMEAPARPAESPKPAPPPAPVAPAPQPAPALHPLAQALSCSALFQTRCAELPAERTAQILKAVDALARVETRALPSEVFAQRVGLVRRRLEGELARFGGVVNVDGYAVLEYDRVADQVRLNGAHLQALFAL
jgi:superfamily II DNA or RNA helicase